jgi:Ca2+-binding RTX toxin-like protein
MRPTNQTRLNVQSLESREVPACIVTQPTPGTLSIVGDGASDLVVLRDDGAGGISGFATGAGAFSFTGIRNIRIATGAGNDRVDYNLIRNLQPNQVRNLSVSLGSGNDWFSANLHNGFTAVGSDLLANSQMSISAFGGDGADSMHINANRDVDVAAGASLKMTMFGDAGNDLMTVYYRGENDGSVTIPALDGGTGDDAIRGVYQADLGSIGSALGIVRGRDGNDSLSLLMFGPNVSPLSLLDGGAGIDTGLHTANVAMINVP